MRIDQVHALKAAQATFIPPVSDVDISSQLRHGFRLLPHESVRRQIARALAKPALRLRGTLARRRLKAELTVPSDALGIGDRFVHDAAAQFLLRHLHKAPPPSVLIPGCYVAGEDVQFWLRRGVSKLVGIDLNSLAAIWALAGPQLERQYGTKVEFVLAPLESTPFDDESFDVVATNAVFEHVSNLPATVAENARILKRGGWAFHSFGPLYFTFGADHCISHFGFDHGYDHLLLDEDEYQRMIWDQSAFDRSSDPNLPFWARRSQFSYATANEYLEVFWMHFHVRYVALAISSAGLRFRELYPSRWAQLKNAGIAEQDLLIKSMSVVLQKK